jgi:hypothetical protein
VLLRGVARWLQLNLRVFKVDLDRYRVRWLTAGLTCLEYDLKLLCFWVFIIILNSS